MIKSFRRLFGGPKDASNETQADTDTPQAASAAPLEEDAPEHPATPHQVPKLPDDLPPPSPDQLKLEALFAHAAHEASKRTEFLNALMNSELLVIGESSPGEGGTMNVQLATQALGDEPVALAFTSRTAMALAGAPLDQPTIQIRTADLVRMLRGQLGFILNPGNRVGKHFTKGEVEQLAGGAGPSIREMPMQENMEVMVGQPSAYPPGLRESLAAAVSASSMIRAIHTGLMSSGEEAPVLIAVISTERELNRDEFMGLINEISASTANTLGQQAINFAPINPGFEDLISRRALIDVTEVMA